MALDDDAGYEGDEGEQKARYAGMAETYRPLERVISGEATMRGTLDALLDGIEADAKLTKSDSPRLTQFGECASFLLSDLGRDYLAGSYKRDAEALLNRKWNALKVGASAVTAAVGLILWAIPPLDIPAYALYLAGWVPFSALRRQAQRGKRAKDCREEVFSVLYLQADILDRSIGRAFVMEDFHSARDRFEKTYQALAPDERAYVGAGLRRMLSAGALDMGEAELDSYLGSLTEEGVAPDA